MATDATISIGIQSTQADAGARRVGRSLDSIKKKASQTTKETNKVSGAFTNLSKVIRIVDGPLGGVSSRFTTLSSVIKDNSASLVVLVAGLAGAGFAITKFIKNTNTQEKALVLLDQTVRSTGMAAGLTTEELVKMSGALQQVTTFGDETTQEMQRVLLTFTKIGRDVFPKATEAVLNLATALNTDLKSAALQIGKALNEPIAGVTALARAGVQLGDSQKALIAEFVAVGKVAEAQKIILAELEVQFGGAARAARNTLGGALTALGNNFGDVFELTRNSSTGIASAIEVINRNFGTLVDTATLALKAITALGIGLVAARIAPFILSIGAASISIIPAITSLNAAIIGVVATTKLLAILASPVFLIGALASAVFLLATRQSEAAKAAEQHTMAMSQARDITLQLKTATGELSEELRGNRQELVENAVVQVQEIGLLLERRKALLENAKISAGGAGSILAGTRFSQGDVATIESGVNNLSKSFIEAQKSLNDLVKQFREQRTVTENVIPPITALLDEIGKLNKKYEGAAVLVGKTTEELALHKIGLLRASEAYEGLSEAQKLVLDNTEKEIMLLIGAKKALKDTTDAQGKLRDLIIDTEKPYEKFLRITASIEKLRPFAKTPKQIQAITRALKEANDEINKFVSAPIPELKPETLKSYEDLKQLIQETLTPYEKFLDTTERLEKLRPLANTAKEIEAIDRAVQNANVELLKALDNLREIENELTPVQEAFQDLGDSITESLSSAFQEMFSKGKADFKSFANSLKSTFVALLSNLVAKALLSPIITTVVQGVGGGGAAGAVGALAGGGGGAGGLTGGLGSLLSLGRSFLSGGASVTSGLAQGAEGLIRSLGIGGAPAVGPLTSGAGNVVQGISAAGTLAGTVGGFGGNLAANAIFGGDRGIGASIGGTVGAIAGQILIPIPVLGAAIGSFVGNAIGGLFGGKPGTKASEFGGVTTEQGIDSTFGSKRASTEFAKNLSSATGDIAEALGQFSGIDVADVLVRGGFNTAQFGGGFLQIGGTADPSTGVAPDPSATIRFDTENVEAGSAALGQLAVELLKVGDVTNESVLIALQNIQTEGRSLEEVLGDIEFAAAFDALDFVPEKISRVEQALRDLNMQFDSNVQKAKELGLAEEKVNEARIKALNIIRQGFEQNIENQILNILDPIQLVLRELARNQAQRRRDAIAIGADIVQVEKLFGLERAKVISDALGENLDATQDTNDKITEKLREQEEKIAASYQKQLDIIDASLQKQLRNITKIQDQLALSTDFSGTNILGRAAEGQKQLDRLADRIAQGDITALDDLNRIVNDSLAAILQGFSSTGTPFVTALDQANAILEDAKILAKDAAEEQRDIQRNILEEALRQTSIEAEQALLLKDVVTEIKTLSDITVALNSALGATSADIIETQGIDSARLLRPGQTEDVLNEINTKNQLSRRLVRQAKVTASAGRFDFSDPNLLGTSFANFIRNAPDGQDILSRFNAIIEGLGGTPQAFANGTPGFSRFKGLAMVGEQGPELVNFGQPAQIFNAGQTGGAFNNNDDLALEFQQFRAQSSKQTQALLISQEKITDEIREMNELMSRRSST